MKNWRTTLFGVLAAAAAGVASSIPEFAPIAGAIATIASAIGLIFAQDAANNED